MEVKFEVGQPHSRVEVVSLEERVLLSGNIPEDVKTRISRTVQYCSVGQYFTKRSLMIQDQVEIRGQTNAGLNTKPVLPESIELPVFVPGRVTANYLMDTQEWQTEDGQIKILHEGEVKIHIHCGASGEGAGHWGLLGGHMSEGWGPIPVAFAIGGLAASTAATLRYLAPVLNIDPADIEVSTAAFSQSSRGRLEAQDAAASGRVREIPLVRKAAVTGIGGAVAPEVVEQAMKLDPIYRIFHEADLTVEERVSFVASEV